MWTHQIPEDFVYLDQYYAQTVKPIKPNIEEIQQHLRYATKQNFTGNIVNGYSATSKAVITRKAAEALYKAQELALNIGYSLMIYDSYRPQKAVNNFVEWAQKPEDCLDCKQCYYPTLKQKKDAFELPDRYIAKQSGHSRGSTVDLTLISKGSKVSFFCFIKID
jgi:D-alanyl-D-alanine dipeptidase